MKYSRYFPTELRRYSTQPNVTINTAVSQRQTSPSQPACVADNVRTSSDLCSNQTFDRQFHYLLQRSLVKVTSTEFKHMLLWAAWLSFDTANTRNMPNSCTVRHYFIGSGRVTKFSVPRRQASAPLQIMVYSSTIPSILLLPQFIVDSEIFTTMQMLCEFECHINWVKVKS